MIRGQLQFLLLLALLGACASVDEESAFNQALDNGRHAHEGFVRCRDYLHGWLEQADPETGLIPRNLNKGKDVWNAQDSAADNYPFMVLTAALLDRACFEGQMREMLRTERRLTARVDSLPDTYSFSKKTFQEESVDLGRLLFGASEYIKDGLLPMTEWLGKSPWSARMIEMLDDIGAKAPVKTLYGRIPSTSHEVNGEMLQALSRVYWMTGDPKYLASAVCLGDHYLLSGNHPTRNGERLRLRDHGCEIVSGLCELYAAVHFAWPEKKRAYEKSLHAMLDCILEKGRNEHGLFYNTFNPQTGEHEEGVADTWGYTLNGFYTVYLIDGTAAYRDAVLKALNGLNDHYRSFAWEGESADGYADSLESALNLYNREPVSAAAAWLDSEIEVMWKKQQPSGIIEGWHGDGNFARTTLMYCLWKTKGVTVRPWQEDLLFGAVKKGEALYLCLTSDKAWEGRVLFDAPRHKKNFNLPLDWPRINQFPEWFTVADKMEYLVKGPSLSARTFTGRELQDGLLLRVEAGEVKRLRIYPH